MRHDARRVARRRQGLAIRIYMVAPDRREGAQLITLNTLFVLFEYGAPRRILDIGTQNMLRTNEKGFGRFFEKYGGKQVHSQVIADLAHRSVIRPGQEGLYLSEVLEHTPIDYVSLDICPGRKTTIFDFNRQSLPWRQKGKFDLVLNCGTSEHILNQLNVFRVIHEATRVGGYMFHQVPTTGNIDHGFFCYHPLLFRNMALANGYEITDMYYLKNYKRNPETGGLEAQVSPMADTGIPVKQSKHKHRKNEPMDIPMYEIVVLYRKTAGGAFRVPLEIETSHAAPDPTAAFRYRKQYSA